MTKEKRKGKERRGGRRRQREASWLMTIGLRRRAGGDRRGGLDRRAELREGFHKEAIIRISRKGIVKSWDSAKGKMTYIWDTGLKAITFGSFQDGTPVEVTLNTHRGPLELAGHVSRIAKRFTEHGFATELDVQFDGIDDKTRAIINQVLWGDGQ